jgi:hypothetical protein
MNLKPYDALEPKRFVRYYEATASGTGVVLVRTTAATSSQISTATGRATSRPAARREDAF